MPQAKEIHAPRFKQMRNLAQEEDARAVRTRREKKDRARRRLRTLCAVVLGIVLILLIPTGLRGLFGAVRMSALTDALRITGRGNLPQQAASSGDTRIAQVKGDMVLLDGATLRVVAKNGAIRFEQAVTYLHPAIHAENGRFLVYDRGGKSLSLYSRTENLSAKTMEQEILTAAVAASGAVGVVTKSETGSSEVVVFDPRGEEIFAWRSAAEYGTTIAFSKNGKRLYAVFLGATAAGHYTRLVVFDLRTGALATDTRLDDVWISQLGVLSSDSFYAAGDAALFFFGEKGAEKERFDYPAGYTCAEFSMSANKRRTALLLEGFGGATRLLQFSAKGKQTADRTFAHGARGLFVENDGDVLALSDGTFVKAEKKRLRQSQDGGDFSAYIWDGRDALGFLNGTVRRFRPKFGGIEF